MTNVLCKMVIDNGLNGDLILKKGVGPLGWENEFWCGAVRSREKTEVSAGSGPRGLSRGEVIDR